MLKYSIGLDMSSKKFNCCIATIDLQQKFTVKSSTSFPNTLNGFKSFEIWIQKHYKNTEIPLVICMEATGIYYENLALYLFQKGFKVSVILPNKAKKYLQAIGNKSKNDKMDAKGLTQMGAEQSLKLWQPMGDFYYLLRTLTRQHQSLQEYKTSCKNQLHALSYGMYRTPIVEKQLKKTILLIEKQLKELEKLIENQIRRDDKVNEKVEKICKIKGVGIHTIATLLAETNGFLLFENAKQLVSYSGYDVVENQSGTHIGKTKISKKGNSRIRRALFLPAFSVVTHQQTHFLNLYNRTLEKHQMKMKSYVAVQKKLLTTIYALWKNNTEFDMNYHQNKESFREKELEDASVRDFEKIHQKKNSPTDGRTIQGKHSSKIRSMSPLCDHKDTKISNSNIC